MNAETPDILAAANALGLKNVELEKQYFSRRNRVYLVRFCNDGEVRSPAILKSYSISGGAENEFNILKEMAAAEIKVPRPLRWNSRYLLIEHIRGYTLTDLLDRPLVDLREWARELAIWFSDYHRYGLTAGKTCLVKEDCNPRNFIYSSGCFFALDFETERRGRPGEDVGKTCAYILTNDPSFTPDKIAAVSTIILRYRLLNPEITEDILISEIIAGFELIIGRRGKGKISNKYLQKDRLKKIILSPDVPRR